MKTYCSILECKICGEKTNTIWHKSKVLWLIEKEILKYKHRKNRHNMNFIKAFSRNK